jgi:hypothetical protein
MIPFKINKFKKILIPNSWNDLTVKQVDEVSNEKEPIKILEIITGLDKNLLPKIFPYLEFILNPLELNDIPSRKILYNNKKIYNVPDIKQKTIGQKILFQSIIKDAHKGNNMLFMGKDLFSVYMYEEISGLEFNIKKYKDIYSIVESFNFVDFYSIVKNLTEQFEEILLKEKELNIPPSQEQIRANVQMFGQLGEMNTIDILSGGDVTKYAEVEKIEYNIVYWKLFKNKLNAIFEKNYKEQLKK